jgi:hypothetical protein
MMYIYSTLDGKQHGATEYTYPSIVAIFNATRMQYKTNNMEINNK